MDPKQSLAIKYTPVFPVFMLLCAAVMLYTTLVIGFTTNTILGVLITVLSVAMLIQPIALITPTGVEQRNLLGRVVRSFTFDANPPAIRGNALYCGATRIFPQWMVNTKLAEVEQFLKAHRLT